MVSKGFRYLCFLTSLLLTLALTSSQAFAFPEANSCASSFVSRRIVIVTDAWNQTNGVVTTLEKTKRILESYGHQVLIIEPSMFGLKLYPLPKSEAVKLAFGAPFARNKIAQAIRDFHPDNLHIATEGPMGIVASGIAKTNKWIYTTSFHTRYEDYAKIYAGIPRSWTFKALAWFHNGGARTLVTTPEMEKILNDNGILRTTLWRRGVDGKTFKRNKKAIVDLTNRTGPVWNSLSEDPNEREAQREKILKGPVYVYFGRVVKDKNIKAFLDADLDGTKIVIGPGPKGQANIDKDDYYQNLVGNYPDAVFVGEKKGQDLVDFLSVSNVFVFPSLTDTFGNVQIEAMAVGVPVAAYAGTASSGVIDNGISGILSADLQDAAIRALELDPEVVAATAKQFRQEDAMNQFLDGLVPVKSQPDAASSPVAEIPQ